MAVLSDLFSFGREVLRLTDKVNAFEHGLDQLAHELRDHDRRLIRIEALVEFARRAPPLPRNRSGDD